MNQIKKARNFLYRTHGRYPDDDEIAKFTGLPLANIQSARQCFRVVGSIDERLGDSFGAKFMVWPFFCILLSTSFKPTFVTNAGMVVIRSSILLFLQDSYNLNLAFERCCY